MLSGSCAMRNCQSALSPPGMWLLYYCRCREPYPATARLFLQCFCNNICLCYTHKTGGRKSLYEMQHYLCKRVAHGLRFRECCMKKPPDLYLCGRYLMAQGFPLPGHVSDILQILRNGKLRYGILMCKDKLGYSAWVLLVSLCLP